MQKCGASPAHGCLCPSLASGTAQALPNHQHVHALTKPLFLNVTNMILTLPCITWCVVDTGDARARAPD
jgi:hypothetical protein